MTLLFLALAAWATEEAAIEVDIEAGRLESAREEVDAVLRDEGYVRLPKIGKRTLYLHPQIWKPRVSVHEEGFARIRGTPIYPLGLSKLPSDGDDRYPGLYKNGDAWRRNDQIVVTFAWQSPRAVRSQKNAIAERLMPRLAEVSDALWALEQGQRELELRDELIAIWRDGTGSAAERRARLIERWLATADSDGGRWAREVIAAFVDGVVQLSDTPFTEAEIADANTRGAPWRFQPVAHLADTP